MNDILELISLKVQAQVKEPVNREYIHTSNHKK